jgi:hypothetical protein
MALTDPAVIEDVKARLADSKPGDGRRCTEVRTVSKVRGTDLLTRMRYSPIIPGSILIRFHDGLGVPVDHPHHPAPPPAFELRDKGDGTFEGKLGPAGGGITNTIDYLYGVISLRAPREFLTAEVIYDWRPDLQREYA